MKHEKIIPNKKIENFEPSSGQSRRDILNSRQIGRQYSFEEAAKILDVKICILKQLSESSYSDFERDALIRKMRRERDKRLRDDRVHQIEL